MSVTAQQATIELYRKHNQDYIELISKIKRVIDSKLDYKQRGNEYRLLINQITNMLKSFQNSARGLEAKYHHSPEIDKIRDTYLSTVQTLSNIRAHLSKQETHYLNEICIAVIQAENREIEYRESYSNKVSSALKEIEDKKHTLCLSNILTREFTNYKVEGDIENLKKALGKDKKKLKALAEKVSRHDSLSSLEDSYKIKQAIDSINLDLQMCKALEQFHKIDKKDLSAIKSYEHELDKLKSEYSVTNEPIVTQISRINNLLIEAKISIFTDRIDKIQAEKTLNAEYTSLMHEIQRCSRLVTQNSDLSNKLIQCKAKLKGLKKDHDRAQAIECFNSIKKLIETFENLSPEDNVKKIKEIADMLYIMAEHLGSLNAEEKQELRGIRDTMAPYIKAVDSYIAAAEEETKIQAQIDKSNKTILGQLKKFLLRDPNIELQNNLELKKGKKEAAIRSISNITLKPKNIDDKHYEMDISSRWRKAKKKFLDGTRHTEPSVKLSKVQRSDKKPKRRHKETHEDIKSDNCRKNKKRLI